MRKQLVVLAVMLVALALGASASARVTTAPTITGTFIQPGRHIGITWALPQDGSTSFTIEVATNPSTGGTGQFFTENIVASDILNDTQTSWIDPDQLPPGTYYAHVSDSNLTCSQDDLSDCFAQQW